MVNAMVAGLLFGGLVALYVLFLEHEDAWGDRLYGWFHYSFVPRWRSRWNRILCSRIGIAVAVLLGHTVLYRVTMRNGTVILPKHHRVVECSFHHHPAAALSFNAEHERLTTEPQS